MRCRPQLEQAVVDGQGEGGRDDALPGVAPVHPVADLRPAGRAADDVGHRQLPGEHVVDRHRERKSPVLASLPAQVADQGAEGARRGGVPRRDRRLPGAQPVGVAAAHLVPGPRVATADSGRSPTRPARSSTRHAVPTPSVVAPGDLLDRVHEQRRQHREPVLDPAARAGQVHHERAAADRRRARGTARRWGRPCAAPYARIASAMPGTSRSSSGRVTSGVRSVGVSPVPPVVTTARAPASTAARMAVADGLAVGYDDRAGHLEAEAGQRLDDQRTGGVLVDARRRPGSTHRRRCAFTGGTSPRTCRRSWSRPGCR